MAHSSKPVGAFVKAIFVIASSVRPMMWLAASGYEPRDHVLHANSTLVDRVDLPSRPGELHPEALTDPYVNLSIHTARATQRRLPPPTRS
jgi:hypothetical protein